MQRRLSLLWLLLLAPTAASGAERSDSGTDFEGQIAPLLVKRCVECHQGTDPAGGLDLTTRTGLTAGGDSGAVLDEHDFASSPLLQKIVDGEMPPQRQGQSQQLPSEEIALLSDWLAEAAPWPAGRQLDWFERTNAFRAGRDWWSLQPLDKTALPPIPSGAESTSGEAGTGAAPPHPIDAFIYVELRRQGIAPAPPADKRVLIRRVYFDLLGLPPSQTAIDAFLADDSPTAWPDLVDSLLAMPQYGQRWGRYWLDIVRYAETSGYERDQEKPYAWKYRDWVIDAFNNDMPYQQFIVEQIAGDEIPERNEQSLVATGFLRLGTWNDEPNEPLDYQYDRLEDLVHTTSSAFLGLTVKCARCHAHKFDPITQEDYYRMASAFWAGPIGQRDRAWLGGPNEAELGTANVLAWTDLGARAPPLHLLKNGERLQPQQEITPATLSFIPALEREFDPPPLTAPTTHRRLQLANWIADPNNPLPARVMVNRLWQHHFGQAIVRTPDNLGFLADPPTHPALLDWLAARFLEHGGSIKQMHRLILTSATWKQSSNHPDHAAVSQRDAANRLWWRAERRRLDADALRDAMLAATGELDFAVGGESFKPTIQAEALEGLSQKSAAWVASPPEDQLRRSIYMYLKRGLLPPLMVAFDACDTTQVCGQRDVTTAPTQSLALLNNDFVHQRSQFLASSIAVRQSDEVAQVRLAWTHILSRPPDERETALALRHLRLQSERFGSRQQALASLCHVLFNSNEFIYVD